jgi:hypothetical protein
MNCIFDCKRALFAGELNTQKHRPTGDFGKSVSESACPVLEEFMHRYHIRSLVPSCEQRIQGAFAGANPQFTTFCPKLEKRMTATAVRTRCWSTPESDVKR